MIYLKSKKMTELPESCEKCYFMIMDDWYEDCCPELGRLYDFDQFETERHPNCPLIKVPDELADVFKYLAASYEVWKRNGNETPLKNALIDAIRFKTDGLSDEDAYRLIRGETINKILFMRNDVSDKDAYYKLIKEEVPDDISNKTT